MKRTPTIALAFVAGVVTVAGALAWVLYANSGNSSSRPTTAASEPTATPDYGIHTLADAVDRVAPYINGSATLRPPALIDDIQYVETTAGEALAMLEPDRPDGVWQPDIAANTPVWVFVAHGRFKNHVPNAVTLPSPLPGQPDFLPTSWAVAFQGYDDVIAELSNAEQFPLGRLGKPTTVPLSQWPDSGRPNLFAGTVTPAPADTPVLVPATATP